MALSEQHRSLIHDWLRAFNQTANPLWWQAMSGDAAEPKPLDVIALNEDNALVGGLLAETSLKWIRINLMVVTQSNRGQGIGRQLLKTAEQAARQRGCCYAFVDTMQYQAPGFYLRCGYDVVGEIPDWDSHDHRKFFMTKSL